jgi:hypothetical protein
LHVGIGTVNKDLFYLRQQAHDNLQMHIQQKLPEEYQNCMVGMKQVLRLSWGIANDRYHNNNNNNNENGLNDNDSNRTMTESDNKTRLQALALINDCYKYIMDLTTNGVVITDAIKFVQTNKEKLITMSNKEDNGKESEEPDYDEDREQLEEKQEDQTGEITRTTTNQVF